LVDENFISFSHDVPITDTLFVSVLLTNDSAIHNGFPVACLIEDYLVWVEEEIIPGTFVGGWVLSGTVGVDMNVVSSIDYLLPSRPAVRKLVSIVDQSGREVNPEPNRLLFFIYDDGSVEKKFVIR
jgi:hypothetical protein